MKNISNFLLLACLILNLNIYSQIQIGEDIDGEVSLDLLGSATAISEDGSIVAVGVYSNDGNGTDSGQVKVYSNVNGHWTQLGSTIYGNAGDYFGTAVALSYDGTILATSAIRSLDYHTKVFKFNGTDWIQLGESFGLDSNDGYNSSMSISLSSNGHRIAIGRPKNNAKGQVSIYQYNDDNWVLLGQKIDGRGTQFATLKENFGHSISLSADGNRIVIGAPGSGLLKGKVRVYEYDGLDWVQMGYDFGPTNQGGGTGASVSMSANGSRIAVSVPGTALPSAIIYDYNGTEWKRNKFFNMDVSRVSLSANGNRLAISDSFNDWTGDGFFGGGSFGIVRIYNYDTFSDEWTQLGTDVPGENAWDEFGASLALSADGKTFIAGAIKNDNDTMDAQGQARIFNINFNALLSTVAFDLNNNGCTLASVLANNVKIKIINEDGDIVSFSNILGLSKALVQKGAFTVTPILNDSRFTVFPVSQEVVFNNLAESRSVNFCISSNETINDVSVTLISLDEARPGFESKYKVIYENLGTTIVDGKVFIQFNENLQEYVRASITPDIESLNTLTYNYANLQPFEKRSIDVTLKTKEPPLVNSGDELILNSQIDIASSSDDNIENNEFDLHETAINSFDPNDKKVLEGNEITIDQVDGYLHYVVRFQNTGTASAINVRIEDVLDEKLDWNTFYPLSSSHLNYLQVYSGNLISFNFENILLPAEQDDEPNSHGFVAFKIKPKSDVQIGDIVTGKASIYFDYNLPIVTNTVSTEIVNNLLGIDEIGLENYFEIYPNPTKGKVYISSKLGVKIKKIALYLITGKLLFEDKEFIKETIDLSQFPKGVYFLNILSDKGSITKKIVVQ